MATWTVLVTVYMYIHFTVVPLLQARLD